MTDDQTGFLIPALTSISKYMKCISPMRWLGFKNPSASATEKYVLSCLIIEVVIAFAFLGPISRPQLVGWWVIGALNRSSHGGDEVAEAFDSWRCAAARPRP
jgi:hypothetical protein